MAFRITFLGTGGGRHSAMYQTRCTGGMLVEHSGGRNLHIDPGPGALTQMRCIRYDPVRTDSVLVSHAHPDHYSDAEVVIEGMTYGGWRRRGHLYGSPTVLEGADGIGPCISRHHLGMVAGSTLLKPGETLDIDGLRMDVCRAEHSDPTNTGYRFHTGNGIVSYVSDTCYTERIADQYAGSRVLILPVTCPEGMCIKHHMCTDDAIEFIRRVQPELTIFTHLGIAMICEGPDRQAALAEDRTGCRTVSARDLMVLDVGAHALSIRDAERFEGIWIPPSAPVDERFL